MTAETQSKCPFGFGAESSGGSDPAKDSPITGDTYSTHMAVPRAMTRDNLPEFVTGEIEPGADGLPTGRCLCGRVSYQVTKPVRMVFANHDANSRRRTGGVALTFMIRAANTKFTGWGSLVSWQASEREIHCFCRSCGTPILVRYTGPERMEGMVSMYAGTLDSMDGMELAADICIDEKPGIYSFEGDRRKISAAELEAMFG